MISPCRKTGWSSSSPCYQAPLQRPAQTCYALWAAICSHLPDPRSVGSSTPTSHPGSSSRALSPQHGTTAKTPAKPLSNIQAPLSCVCCTWPTIRALEGVMAQSASVGAAWWRLGPGVSRGLGLTPHQAPGCRARKRRGPLTGLGRASPVQFGRDTTREPPGFPRGELQVRSDISGLCSGFLEEATAEADPGGWVAP